MNINSSGGESFVVHISAKDKGFDNVSMLQALLK